MKRELAAAALLLLLILGAAWNLRSADTLTRQVANSLDRAEQAARQGEYDKALLLLKEWQDVWNAQNIYTQVFFRHPDLDALQDAFAQAEQLLRQKDPSWPAMFMLLRYHLKMVNQMEHLSWGTVF